MSITLSPGVRTFEHPSGQSVARGAIASRLLAIGMARKGPINTPVAIRSFEQYIEHFGDDLTYGELGIQMRQAFTAGLGDAVVVRTADQAHAAHYVIKSEFGEDTLRIEALDPGELGDAIRVSVDYETPDPELTFNLTFWRMTVDDQDRVGQTDREAFTGLSMDPQASNFVQRIVNGTSRLVRVTRVVPEPEAPDLTQNNEALVYSQSGFYFAHENDLNDFLAAIAGEPQFIVEIDGRDRVKVALENPITQESIQSAINDALGNRSLSARVNVTAGNGDNGFALRIAVNSEDGTRSIRILPAVQNDGAAALALGSLQGGLEVGLYSQYRPAMTGVTTRPFDAADDNTPLEGLLPAVAQPWEINFADGTADGSLTTALEWGIAGATSPMDDGDAGTPLSLASLATNLDSLVATLNAADPLGRIWNFSRIGYRLRAVRNDGMLTPSEEATLTAGIDYFDNAVGIHPAYALEQGSNGHAPLLANYQDAFRKVSREVDIFNMLILPRGDAQTDAQRGAIWGAASAFCREQNALLIMDPRSDDDSWSTVDEVTAKAQLIDFKSGVIPEVSCVFWPRVRTPLGRTQIHVDPSGTMAGVIASTVARLGVWNAAAGLSAPLVGVTGLEYPMSDADNGVINPRGINALRAKSTGNVSWGVRTLAGDDDFSNRDFAYIPVRMTTDFIKNSLQAALQEFVFKPNNRVTWANIEMMCRAFMHGLYEKKAFRGATVDDAYRVRCDETTTSTTDIALGVMNVWVYFAPLFPAEFIHLHVQHQFEQPSL
ncbi:phage tail sheath C-terminal domain-containing protein [Microbulbifer sp. SAOS-129_SWC]|uniref:phage tail sheath family protein n=1 Tax=Microbulbifer sp. SAOS-129_SWC TaxID=3145235 RepID=UPI0032163063